MSTYLVRVPTLSNPANIPADLGLIQADINKFLNQVQNRILGGTATIPFTNDSQAGTHVTFPRAMASVPIVVANSANSIWYYCECTNISTTGFTLNAGHSGGALASLNLVCNWVAVIPG